MSGYKKCPRCELNWIREDEDLCDVCKAELKLGGGIELIEDDEEGEGENRICPICKINPIEEGEIMCAACREEKMAKAKAAAAKASKAGDDSWREFDEDEVSPDSDSNNVYLSQMEDEEIEADETASADESYDDTDPEYDYGSDDEIPEVYATDEDDEEEEDEDDEEETDDDF